MRRELSSFSDFNTAAAEFHGGASIEHGDGG
jgi:hypothetical protein